MALKRMLRQLPNWMPSLATYGAAGAGALVYFTDWRLITDYIPLYNTKYTEN